MPAVLGHQSGFILDLISIRLSGAVHCNINGNCALFLAFPRQLGRFFEGFHSAVNCILNLKIFKLVTFWFSF